MNNTMDNYQISNNGKKLDETTGEWIKMSEKEKLKQARAITAADKKNNWYKMRAFGLVLTKVGNDGSFAEGMKKAVDVKMVGKNNFIVGILEFLQNIPMIGPVLKLTKLEPKEMAEAIAATTALCFENAWEHLLSLHKTTMDLSKLYDVITSFQECLDGAMNGETVFIEQGAAPGGTTPYLNYAWERIVYNIPIYAIVLLNEVQRNEMERKWKKEFLGIEDDDEAANMAGEVADQEKEERASVIPVPTEKNGHGGQIGSTQLAVVAGRPEPAGVFSAPKKGDVGPSLSSTPILERYKIQYRSFQDKSKAIQSKKQEKESNERDIQLAELRTEERLLNSELAALKVEILLEERRAEVNKSILLKGADAVGSAASTALTATNSAAGVVTFGAWKKVSEYIPYLGEEEVRALVYKEMQKCILTWMVPGGDKACEVDIEKVGILQDKNAEIVAALEHEEALFKFTYHQNKLQEFASESNAPAASEEEQGKKDNFGLRQKQFHGLVKPSVGKYIKWALGEEDYVSTSGLSFSQKKDENYMKKFTFREATCLVGSCGNSEQKVIQNLKEELTIANAIIKVFNKHRMSFGTTLTTEEIELFGNNLGHGHTKKAECTLYNIFLGYYINMKGAGSGPDQIRFYKQYKPHVHVVGWAKPSDILLNEISKLSNELAERINLIEQDKGKMFSEYLYDIEERRSALNKVYKFRKAKLKASTVKRGGDGLIEKPLNPEEYKSENNKLFNAYKDKLISVQQDVKDRLWAVKKANMLWWGGAILVAGAIGLFVASGGAAAMLTQVGSMATSAGSALSSLASAAAAKVTALTALIKEKTASGVGKLAMDKIVEWGGTIYSAAVDAIKSFTDQLQDPKNQQFLMMSGAAVGVYGMAKLFEKMNHSEDHMKNFTLATCFAQNELWGRIFRKKVMQKVDEFRTKLNDQEHLEAVKQSEDQAAPECDYEKDDDCLDPDDIENHTRMLSIRLRRNFVERATVNIDWAGCDHFKGGDLSSFLDLRKCVPFFEKYKKLTVETGTQSWLFWSWTDEYDGVVENKKEKKNERLVWAKNQIADEEEKEKEERKKKRIQNKEKK